MGDKWSRGGREVVEPHTGIIISHIQNGNLSLFSQGVLFIYRVGKVAGLGYAFKPHPL